MRLDQIHIIIDGIQILLLHKEMPEIQISNLIALFTGRYIWMYFVIVVTMKVASSTLAFHFYSTSHSIELASFWKFPSLFRRQSDESSISDAIPFNE